jgi:hypothetical protein
MACFACIPLIHVGIGVVIVLASVLADNHGHPGTDNLPPALLGLFFVVFGGLVVLAGWTMAALTIFAGRNLANRRRPTFCFVIACLLCVWVPMGTILGVFTIIVLSRPTVKSIFNSPSVA